MLRIAELKVMCAVCLYLPLQRVCSFAARSFAQGSSRTATASCCPNSACWDARLALSGAVACCRKIANWQAERQKRHFAALHSLSLRIARGSRHQNQRHAVPRVGVEFFVKQTYR